MAHRLYRACSMGETVDQLQATLPCVKTGSICYTAFHNDQPISLFDNLVLLLRTLSLLQRVGVTSQRINEYYTTTVYTTTYLDNISTSWLNIRIQQPHRWN